MIHLKQQISQIFPWTFVTGGREEGCYYFLINFGGFVSFFKLKEITILQLFNAKYLFTSEDHCYL